MFACSGCIAPDLLASPSRVALSLCHTPNLHLQHLYRMLAHLAEALSFVYIGIALPLLGSPGMRAGGWPIAVIMVVLCVAARGISTFVCCRIVNYWRPPAAAISRGSAVVIWMAGLRGGVAFALATAAAKVVTSPDVAAMMPPVTIFIVLVSMLSISTSIGRVIKYFGLDGASATTSSPPSTTAMTDADPASAAGVLASGDGAAAADVPASGSSRVGAMASRAGKLVSSALSRTAAGRTRLESGSGSGAASSDDDRLVRGGSFRGATGSGGNEASSGRVVNGAAGPVNTTGSSFGDAILSAGAHHLDGSPDGRSLSEHAHGTSGHSSTAAALPAKAQSLLLTGHDDDGDARSEHTRVPSASSTAASVTGEADDVAVGVAAYAAGSSSGSAVSRLPPRWPGRVPAGAAASMGARDTDAASGSDADVSVPAGTGSRRSSHGTQLQDTHVIASGTSSLADSRRGSFSGKDAAANGQSLFSAATAYRKPAGHGHDRLFSLLSGTAVDATPAPSASHAPVAVAAAGIAPTSNADGPAALDSAFTAALDAAAVSVDNGDAAAAQALHADAVVPATGSGPADSVNTSTAVAPSSRASQTGGPGARLGKAFASVLMPPPATTSSGSTGPGAGLSSGTAALGIRPQPGAIKRGGHSASFSVLTSGSGGDTAIASPLASGRSAASAPGAALASASAPLDAAAGAKPSMPSALRITSASAVGAAAVSASSSAAPSLASVSASGSKPSLSRNFSTFMSKAAEKFAAAAHTSLVRKDTAGFGRRSAAAAANELTSAAFGLPPVPASYDHDDSSASALDAAIAAEDALVEVSFGAPHHHSTHAASSGSSGAQAAHTAAAMGGATSGGVFAPGRRGSGSGVASEGAGAVLLSPSAGAGSLTGATATASHSNTNATGSSGPEWDARYAIDDTPRPSKTQARTSPGT